MRLTVLVSLLGACFLPVWAQPPELINYQGVLRDAEDAPRNGSYDVIFRFFDSDSGGAELLVDRHLASGTGRVRVVDGLFSVMLGSGEILDGSGPGTLTSLGELFGQHSSLYLQVEIEGEVLSPRTRVVSSGYALAAPGGPDLGTWDARAISLVYQAETDGFVIITVDGGGLLQNCGVAILSDGNDPPTTVRATGISEGLPFVMSPVKKDDYWVVDDTVLGAGCNIGISAWWIPLGQ